nr:Chain P, Peroxisome proliferator activated receptor gamma coactivator 1 alpha [synthetic construct]7E2E_P Chain P, Peroxisome proliferator-activated receptor gamma coactivator 1-alpha [Homo sapiens]7E2E_Q Chain Q, Peroxisome proliferator-activated receptor gamma coactivator 1-alpha [Homo sapiens]
RPASELLKYLTT